MAEATPKRVLPARERRESFKLQDSSPTMSSLPRKTAAPATPHPAPAASAADPNIPRVKRKYVRRSALLTQDRRNSTPLSEDALPTRLVNSKPLPTSEKKAADALSVMEYQSIAESAILSASLHKSRLQWLCDGVFQRYWTKPVKKKGQLEVVANNPEQKSMQKLGACTITIEPHVFDEVVYTVRDPQAPLVPYYRHPNQYPPKPAGGAPPSPFYPVPMHPPPPAQTPPGHATPPVSKPEDPAHAARAPSQKPAAHPSTPTPVPSDPIIKPDTAGNNPLPLPPPPPPPKPKADPVIQMLAARAASDPQLKELMKVVATSKASQAQLKEFQSHIDEFNAVIKREEQLRAQRERAEQQVRKQMAPPLDRPSDTPSAHPARPPPPPAAHPSMYATNAPPSTHPNAPPGSYPLPPPPPAYAHYPPPPRPEPLVKHIVLELTTPASSVQSASQDRWLFPEYAVLDTPQSGRGLEMVCSFFVERQGSKIIASQASEDPPKWKPDVEYYQAVTMTLRAPQHRTLETIARAAKPLVQVQEYMIDVMKKKTRAPEEFLVLQLPRDGDMPMTDGFTDSGVDVDEEDDELKDFYGN